MSETPDDRQALRRLVDSYATAADTRDDELFISLFTPDATLRIHQNGELLGTFAAPDGLRHATAPLDQYQATMHLVANHTYTLDADDGRGTTYCVASHCRPAGDGFENLQMKLRYDDEYRRGDDERWRFSARDLHILWTEIHPASFAPLAF
jgi:hypothetical protein